MSTDKDYIKRFVAMQRLPYEVKVKRAEQRVHEFYQEIVDTRGKNVHISVGGLDSLTLLYFIRSLGYSEDEVPAIGATVLEHKSIRKIHKREGVIVQIENKPAVDIIAGFNYPNVLIYLDPPYVFNTRCGRKQYKFEMDDMCHNELMDVALAHSGPLIISGYDNVLYNSRLKGWHREDTTCYTQACKKTKEVLWMNFEPFMQMKMEDIQGVMQW